MKRTEVQLPEPLYQKVERLATQFHLSVPELLREAAEQMVRREATPQPSKQSADWRFPEGQNLGPFLTPAEDWRLMANEAGAE